jgi:hypothetical protein
MAEVNIPTLVGDEYVQEIADDLTNTKKACRHETLTKAEIKQVQAHLAAITRPSWHRGPPLNLGDASHGKLKADQWRSCIEFDIPVSLAQLWSNTNLGENRTDRAKDLRKLSHSTMLLEMAIRYGTSYRTSESHRERYMAYMTAYLECLNDFPDITLVPNHHCSLHLGEFFLRFGPVHGWWMFPFERIIGMLQKTNTSHKLGLLSLFDQIPR